MRPHRHRWGGLLVTRRGPHARPFPVGGADGPSRAVACCASSLSRLSLLRIPMPVTTSTETTTTRLHGTTPATKTSRSQPPALLPSHRRTRGSRWGRRAAPAAWPERGAQPGAGSQALRLRAASPYGQPGTRARPARPRCQPGLAVLRERLLEPVVATPSCVKTAVWPVCAHESHA